MAAQVPRLVAVVVLLLVLPPPLVRWWQATMPGHMLGQIPLLILAGALLAPPPRRPHDPVIGLAAVLAAGFGLMFWMLPRWLDAAVSDPLADAAKVVVMTGVVGPGLRRGWPQLWGVLRGFFWVQAVAMLAVAGALYAGFPDRLCNAYLAGDQVLTGRLLLAAAAALGLAGAVRALFAAPGLAVAADMVTSPPAASVSLARRG